ncbi:MAG: hypothetical protein EON93_06175 [Burkholderiales bacterium]|nr:MAG: hypothetical protein EON93_06175 [Burkholderiales bacterium]
MRATKQLLGKTQASLALHKQETAHHAAHRFRERQAIEGARCALRNIISKRDGSSRGYFAVSRWCAAKRRAASPLIAQIVDGLSPNAF